MPQQRRPRPGKSSLSALLDRLEAAGGAAPVPPSRDPFELVVWENCAYLVDDARRRAVFAALKKKIGLTPRAILAADPGELAAAIAAGGMKPGLRAEKLRHAAEVALEELGGDLAAVAALPLPQALRAFRKFPSLGEPGAEKVLLFSDAHAVLALESNGLRVLVRLGVAPERKSYAATYRDVRASLSGTGDLPAGVAANVRAHQLLRRHGQDLCLRAAPLCEACPLADRCAYAQAAQPSSYRR